jgi:hypothetical protein
MCETESPMPLHSDAAEKIASQLRALASGQRVHLITIGTLTETQLAVLNRDRISLVQTPLVDEVVFLGRHIYNSGIVKDGYSISDVIQQIESALAAASEMRPSAPLMSSMLAATKREDGYGNWVRDKAVFECMDRHPRPELYSVMPKGDAIKLSRVAILKRNWPPYRWPITKIEGLARVT